MNEQTYSIGPLMKAARKFKKFNQAEVALAIGCSQSALSKMEHNLLVPSAPQWFMFARYTAIPPETLENGIIDRKIAVKYNSEEVSLGFKIPKKYRPHRSQKVRELYPFFQYLEKNGNGALVKEFITGTGIDPEFFVDFDNLVNFQMVSDLVEFMIKHSRGSSEVIREIVQTGQNKIYWDHFGVEWRKLKNPRDLLNEYVNDQMFFQTDFKLRVDQTPERLILSYLPESHLKALREVREETVNFLNQYRKNTIENLFRFVLNSDIKVEFISEGQASPLTARFEVRA